MIDSHLIKKEFGVMACHFVTNPIPVFLYKNQNFSIGIRLFALPGLYFVSESDRLWSSRPPASRILKKSQPEKCILNKLAV